MTFALLRFERAETDAEGHWVSKKTAELMQLPNSIQNLVNFLIASQIVNKVVLFGSRARHQARPNSDYDLAIWVTDRSRWPAIAADIEEKNLTLLPVDIALFEELSSDYQRNIQAEGLLLYG